MLHKQLRFFVDEQDAALYAPAVDPRIWHSASRLLNRCRRGMLKQIVVTDREPSMKMDPPVCGRIF